MLLTNEYMKYKNIKWHVFSVIFPLWSHRCKYLLVFLYNAHCVELGHIILLCFTSAVTPEGLLPQLLLMLEYVNETLCVETGFQIKQEMKPL